MFKLFGKKNATLAGVDIGASSVKVVVLSRVSQGFALEGYAVVPLPQTAVIDGSVQEVDQVAEAIERAVKISGCKVQTAVAAVPSSAVITKRIEMSSAFSEVELEEQVRIEADQFIPYPLEEVALDFEVLGTVERHPELNQLLLVACRKDEVEQREEAVSAAGLNCEIVDVDSYAVERAFSLIHPAPLNEGELIGLADIGASTLTLNIFREGHIVYSREQRFGGNELLNSIHAYTGIPIEDIDKKLRIGELDDEMMSSYVLPFRNTIAQQVSRALQFFYSSGVHNQLNKIYLLGGVTVIPGIADVLQEEVGVVAATANPFGEMQINSKISSTRLQADASTLVKACGLAMRAE